MPKEIILAGQNETIRKSGAQESLDLATIGLFGCVAVIIKDKNGNASLTHVDGDTDLSFIADEIELMGGEYTIDVIKDEENHTELPQKLTQYLSANYKDVKNSKGNPSGDIRTSKQKSVLLRDGKILIPNPIYLQQRATKGYQVPSENVFKNDTVETEENLQQRIYNQQMHGYLRPHLQRKPDVVSSCI